MPLLRRASRQKLPLVRVAIRSGEGRPERASFMSWTDDPPIASHIPEDAVCTSDILAWRAPGVAGANPGATSRANAPPGKL